MLWIEFPKPVMLPGTRTEPGKAPVAVVIPYTLPMLLAEHVLLLKDWRESREKMAAHMRITATIDALTADAKGMQIAESDQPILWRMMQAFDFPEDKRLLGLRCMPIFDAVAGATTYAEPPIDEPKAAAKPPETTP